jgi:hypothetical protein
VTIEGALRSGRWRRRAEREGRSAGGAAARVVSRPPNPFAERFQLASIPPVRLGPERCPASRVR